MTLAILRSSSENGINAEIYIRIYSGSKQTEHRQTLIQSIVHSMTQIAIIRRNKTPNLAMVFIYGLLERTVKSVEVAPMSALASALSTQTHTHIHIQ